MKVLTPESPVIRYLEKQKPSLRKPAAQQLEGILREDIHDITGRHVKYSISFGSIYGVITVSRRDKLTLVDELNFPREFTEKEQVLLPYLGAMYGLKELKKVDLDSKKYHNFCRSLEGQHLSRWLPEADYSYYAWNVGGICDDKKIVLAEKPMSLEYLIGTLGHEAGHSFSNNKFGEENTMIEETFCDSFGEAYKQYFKEHHAGQYAEELFRQKEDKALMALVTEVEALLANKELTKAEQKMQRFRDGSYNQAYLLFCKRYSYSKEVRTMINDIFSLHGPESILLMSTVSTKRRLAYLHRDAAAMQFDKLLRKYS